LAQALSFVDASVSEGALLGKFAREILSLNLSCTDDIRSWWEAAVNEEALWFERAVGQGASLDLLEFFCPGDGEPTSVRAGVQIRANARVTEQAQQWMWLAAVRAQAKRWEGMAKRSANAWLNLGWSAAQVEPARVFARVRKREAAAQAKAWVEQALAQGTPLFMIGYFFCIFVFGSLTLFPSPGAQGWPSKSGWRGAARGRLGKVQGMLLLLLLSSSSSSWSPSSFSSSLLL